MANPAKRKVTDEAGSTSSGEPSSADEANPVDEATSADEANSVDEPAKVVPPKAKVVPPKAKVVPPKAKAKVKAAESSRVTPPASASRRVGPSPRWVPILMFALWGIGLLLIVLNYMGVLPGAEDGSGWYLIAGLVSILAGIMVATQYR
jgi:hypothetical protein